MNIPPNNTIYINNLNEKIEKVGKLLKNTLFTFKFKQIKLYIRVIH